MKNKKILLSFITFLVAGCTAEVSSPSLLSELSSTIIISSQSTSDSSTQQISNLSSTIQESTNSSSLDVSSSKDVSGINVDGYYQNASGKTGFTLKTALHDTIKNHNVVSYDAVREFQKIIDLKPNGTIWDMYSDIPDGTPKYTFSTSKTCGNYSKEGDCWNREHSVPASWFSDKSPMYSDIFHLYPTDGYVNGIRSNYPFGNVCSASWTSTNGSKKGNGCSDMGYTGIVFEPIDAYKGDFARTYFYMATRYENLISSWSSVMFNGTSNQVFTNWAIDLLLEWHDADPVSQKEINRNGAIFTSIQFNRNPFIDHPEFAHLIWG